MNFCATVMASWLGIGYASAHFEKWIRYETCAKWLKQETTVEGDIEAIAR